MSTSNIQKIELGKRTISDELGDAIMLHSGIDPQSLKRRGRPRHLAESRVMWHGPLTTDQYDRLRKIRNPLRRSITLWQRLSLDWSWGRPYGALFRKLELLFEAARLEHKHFSLGIQLDRWIENKKIEFRLRTKISANLARTNEDWPPPFIETLSENFKLLLQARQRARRRKKR